ncbi:MAG TPA: PEP-CTERM sorting domain-containing protein, partial [Tepidisphaeraceae bacterium]|nr:PEP-CTERM sorting domain-containing protein [Tepidisphaeraceae bacterium]
YSPHVGDSFTIIHDLVDQPWIWTFNNLPEGAVFMADSQEFQITYHGGAGNDIVVTAVPEPAAIGMLGIGLALLCRRNRRERWE